MRRRKKRGGRGNPKGVGSRPMEWSGQGPTAAPATIVPQPHPMAHPRIGTRRTCAGGGTVEHDEHVVKAARKLGDVARDHGSDGGAHGAHAIDDGGHRRQHLFIACRGGDTGTGLEGIRLPGWGLAAVIPRRVPIPPPSLPLQVTTRPNDHQTLCLPLRPAPTPPGVHPTHPSGTSPDRQRRRW